MRRRSTAMSATARPAAGAEPPFQRFPTWMWRNTDVAGARRLAARAQRRRSPRSERRGRLLRPRHLQHVAARSRRCSTISTRSIPRRRAVARERYGCLTPWQNEPATYGRAALTRRLRRAARRRSSRSAASCWRSGSTMRRRRRRLPRRGAERAAGRRGRALLPDHVLRRRGELEPARHAHVRDARATCSRRKGPDAKAIVWAHNSHIGDARCTDMGAARGELNIGQLCRETLRRRGGADRLRHPHRHRRRRDRLGRRHGGQARAARRARDSYERLCHDAGVDALPARPRPGGTRRCGGGWREPRLERFIGVIYRPETERWSHYAEASCREQFDAYVWFDETERGDAARARACAGGRAGHLSVRSLTGGLQCASASISRSV